jgi:GTP-binding protein
LGLRFLRHIDRTHLLLFVLDLDPENGRDPRWDLVALEEEIGQYQPTLLQRPRLVALNKVDLPGARGKAEDAKAEMEALGVGVFVTSAVTGEGLPALAEGLIRHALAAGSTKHKDAAEHEAQEEGTGLPV